MCSCHGPVRSLREAVAQVNGLQIARRLEGACEGSSRHATSWISEIMLYTLALILIIAWLLGMVSSYTMGGFIHILLVVAILAILIRLIQGRSV
jgi:hypothetical protein